MLWMIAAQRQLPFSDSVFTYFFVYLDMFNRFLGTAKPVQPKEDKPVDMTRLNEQMSRLDQREERLDKKLEDVERQMAE